MQHCERLLLHDHRRRYQPDERPLARQHAHLTIGGIENCEDSFQGQEEWLVASRNAIRFGRLYTDSLRDPPATLESYCRLTITGYEECDLRNIRRTRFEPRLVHRFIVFNWIVIRLRGVSEVYGHVMSLSEPFRDCVPDLNREVRRWLAIHNHTRHASWVKTLRPSRHKAPL